MKYTIQALAAHNFNTHLCQNRYPGRGIVIGQCAPDHWLMVYWIMGRSAASQNRRLVMRGNTLRTEAVDAAQVDDPSLIIYDAMLELPNVYLVGNGQQTLTIQRIIREGGTFESALERHEHEPDAPHFTPRISAMLYRHNNAPALTLSILKACRANSDLTDRTIFHPAAPPVGLALGITTYQSDGYPLPSFAGEPLWLPCAEDAETMLHQYWDALDAEHRIAIAVKHIHLSDSTSQLFVHNRFG